MAERIKTAREWGLKENSEYHDAKNDQAHLETKIALLRERLSRAKVVESGASDGGVIGFGSTVLCVTRRAEQSFEIVSSQTAAPAQGKISVESPVARGLLGLCAGGCADHAAARHARYTVINVA